MSARNGTLVNDVRSPFSSPFIHYSATYTSERENSLSGTVTVTLSFKAWLQNVSSTFGVGYQLKIYARIAGGQWSSVIIKDNNTAWNGTAKHSAAPLTLRGNVSGGKASVEFYVTREGSRLNGKAGLLGSSGNPKKYFASTPYDSGQSGGNIPYTSDGYVFLKVGSVWKHAVSYIRSGGVWKKATPFIKVSELWKKGVD